MSIMKHTLRSCRQQKRNFITVVRNGYKCVNYTFGKITSTREPGLQLYIPLVQSLVWVDMRDQVYKLGASNLLTTDNLPIIVHPVVTYRIIDEQAVLTKVYRVDDAMAETVTSQVRHVLGKCAFQDILNGRSNLGNQIKNDIVDDLTKWGVELIRVSLDNVELKDDNMTRAIARQAEATRESIALKIRADSERDAALILKEAAHALGTDPFELRRLQSLELMSKEGTASTVLIPSTLADCFTALKKQ